MKRQILILISIGILNILFFSSMFKLFQNDNIYRNTIGLVSQNYERTGGWSDYQITKVSKPFLGIENENFLQWDASIYNCINKNWYSAEESCYGKVRAAFFPLFPFLWKITNASPIAISILNYLMLILSISLLVIYLLPNNNYLRITTFIILVTLPSNVIYMIPYSESLFLFCMTLATIGFLKKNYPLYFVGSLLLAMVRPATVFVLLAIIATEIYYFLKKNKFNSFIEHILLKSLPFLIGYLVVIVIQYLFSGSWTAFWDAQKYWSGGFQGIEKVSDWSIEGFGMNTFSIFFVAIPATAYLAYLGFILKSKKQSTFKLGDDMNYLLLISLFYLAGISIFSLLTSGGNFHSFFRFTICSPLFFIAALILIENLPRINPRVITIVISLLLILMYIYLSLVEYGGDRFQFSFFGLFMFTLTFLYMYYRRFLSNRNSIIILSLILFFNTIWNTYMLNMFFSNGWIFT